MSENKRIVLTCYKVAVQYESHYAKGYILDKHLLVL